MITRLQSQRKNNHSIYSISLIYVIKIIPNGYRGQNGTYEPFYLHTF